MSTQKISLAALFITLSIIGAYIKIPAIIGSIALDSFSALIAAVLFGGPTGAMVAGFGHLISAFIGGMPMGPMHAVIAAEMAVTVWFFSKIYQSGYRIIAGIMFILLNGLVAPLPFAFIISKAFYVSIIPSLLAGSSLNAVIAMIALPKFDTLFSKKLARIWK